MDGQAADRGLQDRSWNRSGRMLRIVGLVAGTIPLAIDTSMLNVAGPTIAGGIDASASQLVWILDSYPIVLAALLVPMGLLGDRVGHRRVMLIGFLVFSLASTAAIWAHGPFGLVAVRVVQGFGAAMVAPGVLAVIHEMYEKPEERVFAVGACSSITTVSIALGPVVGGYLVEFLGWRALFYLNLPACLPAIVLLSGSISEGSVPASSDVRTPLRLIVVATVSVLVAFALKFSAFDAGFGHVEVLAAFALATSASLLWAHHVGLAGRLRTVMSRMSAGVLVPMATSFLVMLALAGFELALAQHYQYVSKLSPSAAGLRMMPVCLGMAVASPLVARIVTRCSMEAALAVSLAGAGLCALTFGIPGAADVRGAASAILFLLGGALSVALVVCTSTLLQNSEPRNVGTIAGFESAFQSLGVGVGIAAFGGLIRKMSSPPSGPAGAHAYGGGTGLPGVSICAGVVLIVAALGVHALRTNKAPAR